MSRDLRRLAAPTSQPFARKPVPWPHKSGGESGRVEKRGRVAGEVRKFKECFFVSVEKLCYSLRLISTRSFAVQPLRDCERRLPFNLSTLLCLLYDFLNLLFCRCE